MSMNCKRYEQDLLLLAHGQLDLHEQARVREHLHACAQCGERLTQLTGVSFLLLDAVQTLRTPSLTLPSRPSFFAVKPSWLLSVFLGTCIVVSVFSVWKSAQSFAAQSYSPPLAAVSGASSAANSCEVAPAKVVASHAGIKATPCPLSRRRAARPSPSALPRKP